MSSTRFVILLLGVALGAACAAPGPAGSPAAKSAPAGGAPSAAAPGASGAPAAPNAGAAQPAALETVEYGFTSVSANYWPIFAAQARGYFEEEGIQLSETSTGSAAAGTLAVVSGSLDIVSANPDPILRSVQGGSDLVMTAGTLNPPIYRLFGLKNVTSVDALKGQTLMMGGPKDVTLYIFDRMVAPYGLRRGDFDYVYAGGTPDRYRALQSGAVAATLLYQPYDFVAQKEGYPLLLDSYDVIKDLVFSSFTVSRPWLANEGNRGRLVRWLGAAYRGAQAVCDPAQKDDMIRILADKTRLSEEDARLSYDLIITDTHSMKCDLRVTTQEFQRVLDYIVEMGDMTPPLPDLQRIVDTSYLEQAIARAQR